MRTKHAFPLYRGHNWRASLTLERLGRKRERERDVLLAHDQCACCCWPGEREHDIKRGAKFFYFSFLKDHQDQLVKERHALKGLSLKGEETHRTVFIEDLN